MPANSLKNSIGHDVWDSYFKFCVIRNPYDKLISAYFFQNQTSDKSVEDFRSWLIDGAHVNDRQTYMIENKVCIDFFIRFEQLNNDVMKVCEKLNIPFIKSNLPKLKTKFRNRQIPLKEFYNDQTIRIVKKKYEFELDYFEYEAP